VKAQSRLKILAEAKNKTLKPELTIINNPIGLAAKPFICCNLQDRIKMNGSYDFIVVGGKVIENIYLDRIPANNWDSGCFWLCSGFENSKHFITAISLASRSWGVERHRSSSFSRRKIRGCFQRKFAIELELQNNRATSASWTKDRLLER
jgi:hypothetical protein